MTPWLVAALALGGPAQAAPRIDRLAVPALAARLRGDARAAAVYRQGALATLAFLDGRPDLVPPVPVAAPRVLRRGEREEVWTAWKSFLDYLLALDSLAQYHRRFHRLDPATRPASLRIFAAAWLGEYRAALEWIERAERDPGLDKLLNEPVGEIGLPGRTYAALKDRFLNLRRAGEFAALEAVRLALMGTTAAGGDLDAAIAADVLRLRGMGRGPGPVLTLANGWRMIRSAGFHAWFPVQAGLSEWMGDTKVYRKEASLITPEQIAELQRSLEPGDVLLVRREWYLSNIGLPGFWPHAALYVGTPGERDRYFADPDVRTWLAARGDPGASTLDDLLRARFPTAYAASLEPFAGHTPRILEAMSEGVVFTSIEHSAEADSVAVLRPRLGKVDRAAALLHAFRYAGRPYDFNFDFLTDATIVCSELVFKAYEPAPDGRGLSLPLLPILGRMALPPNDIVRLFDADLATPAQKFDLVSFLDGHEHARLAVAAPIDVFRASWRRPKWHVFARVPR